MNFKDFVIVERSIFISLSNCLPEFFISYIACSSSVMVAAIRRATIVRAAIMGAVMVIIGVCCDLVAMFMVWQRHSNVGSIATVVVALSASRPIDWLGTVAYGFSSFGDYTAVLYGAIGRSEYNRSA